MGSIGQLQQEDWGQQCGDSLRELGNGRPRAGEQSATANGTGGGLGLQEKKVAIVGEGKRRRGGPA